MKKINNLEIKHTLGDWFHFPTWYSCKLFQIKEGGIISKMAWSDHTALFRCSYRFLRVDCTCMSSETTGERKAVPSNVPRAKDSRNDGKCCTRVPGKRLTHIAAGAEVDIMYSRYFKIEMLCSLLTSLESSEQIVGLSCASFPLSPWPGSHAWLQ